jgi:hypothetical protein
MFFRNFYVYFCFKYKKIVQRKIFSNYVYPKYLIRYEHKSKMDNQASFVLIDSNYELSSFFSPNKSIIMGAFFSNRRFFFKSNNLDSIRFKSFLIKKIHFSFKYSTDLYKKIKTISKSKKAVVIYLIKPIKGGFSSLFCGFLGFLPRKGVCFFLIKLILNFCKKKHSFSNLFFFIDYHQSKKYFYATVPFSRLKISFYPTFTLYKSYRNKYVLRRFKSSFNTIFLIEKKKLSKQLYEK